jgi:chromatin-remodeling ATPase INO80
MHGMFIDISLLGVTDIISPDFGRLIADSGKLVVLDKLLADLGKDGHKVLIFSQMTKMMDILEDYFWFRKFKYLRLDGSSSVADRRDMVNAFQDEGFVIRHSRLINQI